MAVVAVVAVVAAVEETVHNLDLPSECLPKLHLDSGQFPNDPEVLLNFVRGHLRRNRFYVIVTTHPSRNF